MNIAIVGSSGYIAGFLLEKLKGEKHIKRIVRIDKNNNCDFHLDLLHAEKFKYDVLDEIDFIIFTAAISGPDKCALDFELCWSINVIGTSYFINEAIKRKCKVLFFSSDAVFGDISGKIYDENSDTRAITAYGKMKKSIEDQFKENPYFKAIRLSYVASAKDRFISYCLKCLEDGQIADIYHPFYRNVTVISDVGDVVVWFSKHWDDYTYTFLNVAGTELVSRVRIADEINRLFNNKLKYTISTPDASFYNNRPSITQMKSIYMEKFGITKISSFTEKLEIELKKGEL